MVDHPATNVTNPPCLAGSILDWILWRWDLHALPSDELCGLVAHLVGLFPDAPR